MIGAGMIANVHAKAIKSVGTIIAVHDPREERAKKFAEEHSCEVLDNAELFSREDIDGVVIAVPNDRHAEIAVGALNSGKHVLLEKPMALSLSECDQIISARNKSNKQLQMGFVCRYSPASLKTKQIIESGLIGDVQHVNATLLRQRGIPGLGGWFTTKKRSGGGCLIDIGVHLIDLVMHLTSKRTPVSARGKCTQLFTTETYSYDEMWSMPVEGGTFDVEDRVSALLADASGTTFQFDVSWATHIPENTVKDGLIIEGSKGSLIVDLWSNELIYGFSDGGVPKSKTISFDVTDSWDDAFEGEHLAFASAIKNGKLDNGAGTAEDGRLVQSVVELIYESDKQNRETKLQR
jgi:predicted dehydrogenase